jgi:hypothetical protein
MKRNIWVCGLIGGVIAAIWGVVGEGVIGASLSLNTRLVLGYASMIVAFSLIFVAVKNYRDDYNNGTITFWNALKTGLLITLIASTVYVVVWLVDYSYFNPDFGEKYQAQMLAEMKANGASAAAILKQGNEMTATMAKYKTSLLFRTMFTYLEIVPVGVVVSLIAAFILKNNPKIVSAKA